MGERMTNNEAPPKRGQIYRLLDSAREIVAVRMTCNCGREYRLGLSRMFNDCACACGMRWNLLDLIGYSRLLHTPADLHRLLSEKLEEHRESAQQHPRHLDTWNDSGDGGVTYERYTPNF